LYLTENHNEKTKHVWIIVILVKEK